MRILIVGSGGREHALTWALSRDPNVKEICAAPGNPGIAEIATCVPIGSNNIDELASFASKHRIDLTVVGPEATLGAGIVDAFRKQDLAIFGPDKQAARIETSKSFAKELCTRYALPTPRWESFTNESRATRALDELGPPWVIKADGLAAGKGTTVTRNRREAEAAIQSELEREPRRIVMEEFIDGWEASFTATVSADRVQWLAPVFQDYKPANDGDYGPNTGGMGVFTPVSSVTQSLVEKVRKKILDPVAAALAKEEAPFQGVLYLNVIVKHGTEDPYVLEFNARFGDPEAQGIMPLVKRGLLAHLSAVATNSSKPPIPECSKLASVVVVLASKGYPENPSKGDPITLRPLAPSNVMIFHAGTVRTPNGQLVTAGGRVLNISSTGLSVESARKDAYSVIGSAIKFPGMKYRSDIGSGQIRRRQLEPIKT
ncbi:MAG: phosphoribosylamine--glycine ligase [Crenarchaeota archaeon 13_1_40CM_3_52_4]|nr:MAG: phosphoribosylamine--glycine ligase [Crenarchaeota archaeon 13_1_40CM_3_52_4]